MAGNKPAADVQQLPEIIVLGPPTVFGAYDEEFNSRFRVLKPWESPLPLVQFLEGRAHNTRAALCSASVSLSAALLSILPSLRLIVATSAGLNHIDLTECRRRGIAVAYAASLFSADAADFAVGLLLNVLRKISAGNRFVKDGLWPERGAFPLGFKGAEIGGAGLDVFEHEPHLPHELLQLDNVAAVLTRESMEDLFQLVVANFEAFFLDKPLISPVPKDYLPQ